MDINTHDKVVNCKNMITTEAISLIYRQSVRIHVYTG